MKPYDCHAHLYDKSFEQDLDKVLERARKVLSGIVVVGEDAETNRKVLALCKKHFGFLFPGLAIHPDKVHMMTDVQIGDEINFIKKQKNLVCIGECGLDYKWEANENPEESKRRQQKTFEKLIKLADEMNLPLNIHSRRATKPVVETLERLKPKRAMSHGFSGTLDEAKRAAALGYKIAIGTSLLWKNNEHSLNYLENLALSDFVLETDSPVLAPIRGQRNEPANIALVVKEIARIKCVSEEEVIKVTNKNVKYLFNL